MSYMSTSTFEGSCVLLRINLTFWHLRPIFVSSDQEVSISESVECPDPEQTLSLVGLWTWWCWKLQWCQWHPWVLSKAPPRRPLSWQSAHPGRTQPDPAQASACHYKPHLRPQFCQPQSQSPRSGEVGQQLKKEVNWSLYSQRQLTLVYKNHKPVFGSSDIFGSYGGLNCCLCLLQCDNIVG